MRFIFQCSIFCLVLVTLWSNPLMVVGGEFPADTVDSRAPAQVVSGQKPGGATTSPGQACPEELLVKNYGRLPLYFIKNQGQMEARVEYYVRGRGQHTFFTQEEIVMALFRPQGQSPAPGPDCRDFHNAGDSGKLPPSSPRVVTMQPVGMKKGLQLAALEPQKYKVNYFKGNDPQKWRTDIPTFKVVAYQEAYPGIDLKFYGQGREMEYDIVVKPGADPSQVRFAYRGIDKMEVTPDGHLALKLPDGGVLVQRKPVVYQEIAGQRVAREGKFLLQGGTASLVFGFEVAAYDKTHPLFIDPVLVYSTYLGGSLDDQPQGIGVDGGGRAVVTGYTASINFPQRNELFVNSDGQDVFVTRFSRDGSELLFSTYLGGEYDDYGRAIALDNNGGIYITGETYSLYFPTTDGTHQRENKGACDAFVAKLNAAGNNLEFSTYLGGTKIDKGRGVAVDQDHNVYITGNTRSSDDGDFPIKNAGALYPTYRGGTQDAFVSKLSAGWGTLLFSTFLGGSYSDDGASIAVSSDGQMYVTGNTDSSNFPVHNAIYNSSLVAPDAFVTSIKADFSGLAFSTYLPGNKSEYGNAVALDTTRHVYVGGYTNSTDFPTSLPRTSNDAFLIKLNPDGSGPIYATSLGGSGTDQCFAIAVNSTGEVILTGATNSNDFPTKPHFTRQTSGYDAFVAHFRGNGRDLVYSTYLGGDDTDYGIRVAVDKDGAVYVTGVTYSGNFPWTEDAYSNVNKGGSDVFVTKIKQSAATILLDLLLFD